MISFLTAHTIVSPFVYSLCCSRARSNKRLARIHCINKYCIFHELTQLDWGVFLPNKIKRLQCRNTEASFCVTKHGQHAILFSVSYYIIFCIRRQAICCCMSYKKPLPDHFLLCRSFEEIVSLYLYICHAETRLYRYIWQRLRFENPLLSKIHCNRIRNVDIIIGIAVHYRYREFEGLKLIL